MSIKGKLESLGLEELLQADLTLQGEGRLVLRNGAHYAALQMTREGAYVVHPDLLDAELILRRLVDRGLVDAGEMARTRRHHLSDVLLLDALVESGDLPEAELMAILAREAEDTILDLMLWDEGNFSFESERVDPAERGLLGRICVDPAGICDRAMERIEERRSIGDLLGDSALLFAAATGELPALSDDHDITHAVYARLNGQAVAHEIALELSVGRFEVLRAVAQLVGQGLARPATPEELVKQATLRTDAGQPQVARALVLQWAQVHPTEEGPLRKLASLAAACRDKQAELEALCALGHQQLQQGNSQDALETFTRAMRKAPADDVVIAGLQLAAEATGDNDSLVDGALLRAQSKIDEGAAQAALDLLLPLLESYPDNMGLHLMRARALVMLEKRTELLEQAEIVGQVLGRGGCNSQVDREAVEFFREAIETVAPDRGDLLERFRMLHDPRRARRRRMAITGALLLLVCSAGVFFWPASAATLLAQATAAADAGNKEQAGLYLEELTNRFPEAPEVAEAVILQNRLFPPHNTLPRHIQADQALQKQVEATLPELGQALAQLPAEEARERVRKILGLLETTRSETSRADALKPLAAPIQDAADHLNQEAVSRVKLLAQAAGMNEAFQHDAGRLRDFLERADRMRDAAWLSDLRSTSALLSEFAAGDQDGTLSRAVRELTRSASALEKATEFYDAHAGPCRLTLAGLEIEEADRVCREEAPKLMVGGRLDEADALYKRLELLLARYGDVATYQELIEKLRRRQIPTFIRERRAQIADIRSRITAARAAERRDDLEEAVRIYAGLITEYWLIRFESVFTLPLGIETLPAGADVYVNDELVGRSPTVVRYTWGSDATIRVTARHWASHTQVLRTAEEVPPHVLHVRLAPAPIWRATLPGTGTVGVMALGKGVLRADRNGTITLHDGRTGAEKWSARTSSLEGVRGRPARAGRHVYVPQVNGEVLLLDPTSGALQARIPGARPIGDMASQGELAARTSADGSLVAFRGRSEAWRLRLGATPTAGVVGAHGAFWVGTARGSVIRVGALDGRQRSLRVAGGNVPVTSLVATDTGMLLTTATGTLVALSPAGTLRWRADGLGDLVGTPAQTSGRVAAVNRAGRLALLNEKTGAMVRTFELGKGASHGVIGAGGVLFAARSDGHAWAFDVSTHQVVMNAPMGLHTLCTPTLLGSNQVVVCLQSGHLAVLPLPRLP